jgi:hypothetical protein
MSFTYRIESGMLWIRGEGTITQAERLATMRAWLGDEAFHPSLPALCDFSGATSTPTLPELREIAEFIKTHGASIGPTRLAIVTVKPVTFGVARQFQALLDSGPVDVHIFRDREDALTWLREERT